ncbi:MAG: SpoIID/LytB domain-containing protein [Bacillota bacterium]|nr:SpoIID/LytB domain-containing protein [Bacillota bacterium]
MKTVYSLLCFLLLFSALPQASNAAEAIQYSDKVNVSIFLSNNFPIFLNGNYQLVNKDTNEITVIPAKTTLTIKKDSSSMTVSYSGFNQKSTAGFDLQELSGTKKLAIFTMNTEMKRGASTDYDTVKVFNSGESADLLDSFTNSSGQVWYKVGDGNVTGWVPSTYVLLNDITTLSLATVNNNRTYRGSFFLKPNGSQTELVNILDMEDYLKGVVPSEMPASWPKEALKAQAIAARSYAANIMMLASTAASQVYGGYSAEDPRTNEAIKETEGLLVKYNGKPIEAFFHSTSGGRTANVSDVWNSDQKYFPYLVSVDDPYESSQYSSWTKDFPASSILKAFGFSSDTVLYDMAITKSGTNQEVRGITVKTSNGDKTINGNESDIRKLFPLPDANVYKMLYSNWFTLHMTKSQADLSVQTSSGVSGMADLKGQMVQTSSGQIAIDSSNVSIQTANGVMSSEGSGISTITVTGKGWGHRIGMSQYGAKGFAEHGYTAEQILTHYFTGTTVEK